MFFFTTGISPPDILPYKSHFWPGKHPKSKVGLWYLHPVWMHPRVPTVWMHTRVLTVWMHPRVPTVWMHPPCPHCVDTPTVWMHPRVPTVWVHPRVPTVWMHPRVLTASGVCLCKYERLGTMLVWEHVSCYLSSLYSLPMFTVLRRFTLILVSVGQILILKYNSVKMV